MEIELKYSIRDKETADLIWEDDYLSGMEEKESREALYMKASYFDTPDAVLRSRDIAFRVRMEGEKIVATMKWNGKSEGALHTREEINVPVDDEACLISPDLSVFKESSIGQEVMGIVGEKSLESTMEVGFLRRRFRIDTGNCIIEISIDNGEIVTDNGSCPICEVELEFFSGDEDELMVVGEKLAQRYDLVPEKVSKYARGLELIEKGAN
ncbi:MAG: CYTH domain-containing protein [Clostridia bacterium]|nr:CYTH domain-containing protein [Clostridia bacterium]